MLPMRGTTGEVLSCHCFRRGGNFCKWVRQEPRSALWALPAMARSSKPTGRDWFQSKFACLGCLTSWDGFRIAQLSDLHYDDYFSVVPLAESG